jgi:hypothetical protein
MNGDAERSERSDYAPDEEAPAIVDVPYDVALERLRARAREAREQRVQANAIDMDAERARRAAAREAAFGGVAGETYFPAIKCAVCGRIPWLDTNGIVRSEHDPDMHGVGDIVTDIVDYRGPGADRPGDRRQRDPTRVNARELLDEAIERANRRARESTGERLDE